MQNKLVKADAKGKNIIEQTRQRLQLIALDKFKAQSLRELHAGVMEASKAFNLQACAASPCIMTSLTSEAETWATMRLKLNEVNFCVLVKVKLVRV